MHAHCVERGKKRLTILERRSGREPLTHTYAHYTVCIRVSGSHMWLEVTILGKQLAAGREALCGARGAKAKTQTATALSWKLSSPSVLGQQIVTNRDIKLVKDCVLNGIVGAVKCTAFQRSDSSTLSRGLFCCRNCRAIFKLGRLAYCNS